MKLFSLLPTVSFQWTVQQWHDMWGRLSNVASGVDAPPESDELTETRELLNHTQGELRAALQIIEERDREIQNHSRASQELSVSEEVEKIREKLQSEDVRIDDVISDISFSLNEKSSTISQLQHVIDDLKDRQSGGGVDPHEFVSFRQFESCSLSHTDPSSLLGYGAPSLFWVTKRSARDNMRLRLRETAQEDRRKRGYHTQVLYRLHTLCELDELRCQLTDARAKIRSLQSENVPTLTENGGTNEIISRLEEENRLLLGKVASEAAHKDILRDQLDELKENNQEKFHLLENLKELQEEFQTKTAELMKERERVSELSEECELLRNQITEILADKQRKIKENLFEVKEEETGDEELDRLRVENGMLITRVSDLVAARDKAREDMEVLTERVQNSSDGALSELLSKERELEDAMMTVSLMQEQLRERKVSGAAAGEQIHSELQKARREIEECVRREAELREQISELTGHKSDVLIIPTVNKEKQLYYFRLNKCFDGTNTISSAINEANIPWLTGPSFYV
eukprot:sb/3463880/